MADDYENDDDQTEQPSPRDLRSKLDEANRKAAEAEARAATVERRLAFSEAGIDTADPKLGYFMRGYDGEITRDAIKAAALEAGFLSETPAPPQTNQEPPTDLAAAQRVAAAQIGAGTPVPTDLATAFANAKSAEEVLALIESPEAAALGLRTTRQLQ